MSPNIKSLAMSNVYTTMLALSIGAVLATACYVAYMCLTHYGTILQIIQVRR